jgi:hypothetical protein
MDEPTPKGRQLDGRFATGNRISQGNIGNKRMQELRRALLGSTTPEDVQEVGKALLEMAIGGDVAAAKVLLDHVVGKPVQAVELSGPDGVALDLPAIVSTIMIALGDDLTARVKVAAAFRRLGETTRDGGLERAEPGD